MPEREAALIAFLEHNNWTPEARSPLADDASFRSYERLRDGTRQAVLMNAPPPEEDTRPFIRIANHLRSLNLSAPVIYAHDTDNGFLLLEDFGDATYTQVFSRSLDREQELYELAVDVLIYMHRLPADELNLQGLARYDTQAYLKEVALFTGWYLPQVLTAPLPREAEITYKSLWQGLFSFVETQPQALVLRDYHVDNLVWLETYAGLQSCGLLDFQDALIGSRAYDLMSLLEDARRDVSDELAAGLLARYFAAFDELSEPGPARDAFEAIYAILGAGRHAKVIGIFTRLCVRDGKPVYLAHIPRVWRLLERSLGHPMLSSLADWFDTYVPQNQRKTPSNLIDEDK